MPKKPEYIRKGLLEIPVSSIPGARLPFGLVWTNWIGLGLVRLLFRNTPDCLVMYLHPFDLLEVKHNRNFGFLVNQWYGFRSENIRRTFEGMIEFFMANGYEFVTMKDIAEKRLL